MMKIVFVIAAAIASGSAFADSQPQIPEGAKLVKVTPIFQTIAKPLCMDNEVTGQKECIPQYWDRQIGVQATYLFPSK